ncbi:hypothetical protein J1N35_029897 [Gossypium stocksii]|uniref:Uncharacterized protein n=1 Tax=Gossypium stocksii TaxID=47602 RepID=A0A9D3UZ46_9ROSI|nr:hypothetical protein J1N35_029897 [Gossypium stocksii]
MASRRNNRGESNTGRNLRGDLGIKSLFSNSINLETGQKLSLKGQDRWHNLGKGNLAEKVGDDRFMNLRLNEENDPLIVLDGKKCQSVVEYSTFNFRSSSEGISIVVTASSVEQSSRKL